MPQIQDSLERQFLSAIQLLELDIEANFSVYWQYLQLLEKWNKAYNLTAIRDIEAMLPHHVLDSLAILPFIKGVRCLDVGTGAGLPGLMLAMAQPEQHWTLVDSNIKKARFVEQVKLELGLMNVEVIHTRIEELNPEAAFHTVVSRAFTSLKNFYSTCHRFKQNEGVMLAMKAGYPEEEVKELKSGVNDLEFFELDVPGLAEKRGLFQVR